MTDFDDVIEDLGTFGPYQIQVVVLVSLFEVVPAMCVFMPVFSEALPQWRCPLQNDTDYNQTLYDATTVAATTVDPNDKNLVISGHSNDTDIQMCHSDGTFCKGAVFLTSESTIRTEWDFCEETFLISPITMFPMVGAFLGALVFGQLGDSFGRKPMLFLSYILLLLAQGVMSFVHIWHLYMICRFLVGFAGVGVSLLNFVLPVEVVGKNWRALCAVPIFGVCGGMLLTLMAFLLPNWRHLSITCAAMGIPLLFTWWLIPESPRWHMVKGNNVQANAIIKKMADTNNKEYTKFTGHEEKQRCILNYSYCDLFRGRSMVRNILIMMFIWFVCSICYNASFDSIGTFVPNPYINFFLLQASELPVFVFVILVSDKLGRTKCLSSFMMVAGLSCLVILLAETLGILADMEWQVKGCALLTKGSIVGAWVVARIMSAELFPTLLRCVGTGACKMAFELGKLMVPLIVSLDHQSRPLPFIVLGCMTLITAVVSLCLPETVHKNLPDTMPSRRWCGCCGEDRDEIGHRHRDYSESQCVDNCIPLSDYDDDRRECAYDRQFRS